jgi:predicted  nucleic acid-binding Zn-ribbon protein
MARQLTARNRCCDCGHGWTDFPIGFARHHACPACGSAYWQWLNYGESQDRAEDQPAGEAAGKAAES